MFGLIQSGVTILGISFDPALLCFIVVAILFGGMNLFEYKRFD